MRNWPGSRASFQLRIQIAKPFKVLLDIIIKNVPSYFQLQLRPFQSELFRKTSDFLTLKLIFLRFLYDYDPDTRIAFRISKCIQNVLRIIILGYSLHLHRELGSKLWNITWFWKLTFLIFLILTYDSDPGTRIRFRISKGIKINPMMLILSFIIELDRELGPKLWNMTWCWKLTFLIYIKFEINVVHSISSLKLLAIFLKSASHPSWLETSARCSRWWKGWLLWSGAFPLRSAWGGSGRHQGET